MIFVMGPWLLGSVNMLPLGFGFPDTVMELQYSHSPSGPVVALHSNIDVTAGKE